MSESKILEAAIREIELKNLGFTEQFLEIHKIEYVGNKPKIARIDTDNEDEAIVYFNVKGEKFYFVVYVDLNPNISVRWTNTEAYHSVYFKASSDQFLLKELLELTKLTPTESWNKEDIKPSSKIKYKESSIIFEPNPEAGEFCDKLTKLLDYLEQDKDGLKKLTNNANCGITVWSCFHNGNTMLGGYDINKEQIERMSKLNLDIYFDVYAKGNFFK